MFTICLIQGNVVSSLRKVKCSSQCLVNTLGIRGTLYLEILKYKYKIRRK